MSTSYPPLNQTAPRPTCKLEVILSNGVVFKWPETASSSSASFVCPNNMMFTVTRQCYFDGQWGIFNDEGCGVLATQFGDINVASENVMKQLCSFCYNSCHSYHLQLTNETLVQTVETLTVLAQASKESPVEQSMGNLNAIASTLVNVASFVVESKVEINATVSRT